MAIVAEPEGRLGLRPGGRTAGWTVTAESARRSTAHSLSRAFRAGLPIGPDPTFHRMSGIDEGPASVIVRAPVMHRPRWLVFRVWKPPGTLCIIPAHELLQSPGIRVESTNKRSESPPFLRVTSEYRDCKWFRVYGEVTCHEFGKNLLELTLVLGHPFVPPPEPRYGYPHEQFAQYHRDDSRSSSRVANAGAKAPDRCGCPC